MSIPSLFQLLSPLLEYTLYSSLTSLETTNLGLFNVTNFDLQLLSRNHLAPVNLLRAQAPYKLSADIFLHPVSTIFSYSNLAAFVALMDLTINPIGYIELETEYLDEEGLDIRYAFKYTLPDAKLTYPEPHVASPSYLHQDLSYLCILQY